MAATLWGALRRQLCTTTRGEMKSSGLRTICKAILVGRLGQMPQLREWDGGGRTLELSVATKEREEGGETQWHKVYVQDGTMGFDYLRGAHKGALVYVEGELRVVQRTHAEYGRVQYVNVNITRGNGGTVRVLDGQVDWQGGT